MLLIANEIREILTSLGVKSISEIIGKTEFLKKIDNLNKKQSQINIEELIAFPEDKSDYKNHIVNNPYIDKSTLMQSILNDVSKEISTKDYLNLNYKISNTDRSIPSSLNYHLLDRLKKDILSEKQINLNFKGYAGQSFGAFLIDEITIKLDGIANDYVGKSLSGGKIIIKSPHNSKFPIIFFLCLR